MTKSESVVKFFVKLSATLDENSACIIIVNKRVLSSASELNIFKCVCVNFKVM